MLPPSSHMFGTLSSPRGLGFTFASQRFPFLDSREGVPLSPTVFNRKIIAILKDETNEFTFSLAVVKEQ